MITLICGRARAGKSTYSERFENVIHLDSASKLPSTRYQAVLNVVAGTSEDIVIEGVYETADKRKTLLAAYKGKGAKCIFIDTSLEVIAKRIAEQYSIHNVLPRVFEPPTYDEGWDEIIRITAEETSAF